MPKAPHNAAKIPERRSVSDSRSPETAANTLSIAWRRLPRRIGGLTAIYSELMSRRRLSRGPVRLHEQRFDPARIDLDQAFRKFPEIQSLHIRTAHRGNASMDTVR